MEYEGTEFHGWQIQKGRRTVQGVLIEAIGQILQSRDFKLVGASRTDSGVHAENQVFSLHLNFDINMDLSQFKKGLNALLPADVYVKNLELTSDDFNARRKAKSKIYRYRILEGKRSPLRSRYVWELPYYLDECLLNDCAKLLRGEIDFSFLHFSKEKQFKKVIFYDAHWKRKDDELHFYVEGSHFLYRLVRLLVGNMVYSVKNFGDASFFERFLKGGEEKLIVAPARGLTLVDVKY